MAAGFQGGGTLVAKPPALTANYRQRPRRKTGPLSYLLAGGWAVGPVRSGGGIERLRGCPQSKHQAGSTIQIHSQMKHPLLHHVIPFMSLSLQSGDIGDIPVLVLPGQAVAHQQVIARHLVGIKLLGGDSHAP